MMMPYCTWIGSCFVNTTEKTAISWPRKEFKATTPLLKLVWVESSSSASPDLPEMLNKSAGRAVAAEKTMFSAISAKKRPTRYRPAHLCTLDAHSSPKEAIARKVPQTTMVYVARTTNNDGLRLCQQVALQ